MGAWVGWSTRYWPSKNFKIEGFDSYASPNVWKTIADYSTINYSGSSFVTKIPSAGAYTKLKFTFYSATGTNGRLGISELFFINPEAVRPYEGLFETSLTNNWINNGTSINYMAGKVGIGTTVPDAELTVKGMIHAREVKVDLLGPLADYVFENYYNGNSTLNKEYKFLSLNEVEKFTKENKHLPNVPSAQEVKENGVQVGEITNILLEKVEELTLYLIEQKKEIERLKTEVNELKSAK